MANIILFSGRQNLLKGLKYNDLTRYSFLMKIKVFIACDSMVEFVKDAFFQLIANAYYITAFINKRLANIVDLFIG